MSSERGVGAGDGPICPNCRLPLRETLRSEEIAAVGAAQAPPAHVSVIYCGSCGWTLAAAPAMPVGRLRMRGELQVVDPDDSSSLPGQFQLRCRELVKETITAGFTPGGWIGLINQMGALEAAQHLLSTGTVLPVTPWLVAHGRPELTMEHEITQQRWMDLFTDEERAEAARRLDT